MALSVGSNVAEMKAGDNKASLFDEYDFVAGGMLEEVKDFDYTGAEQSYSVKQTGRYKLQVWGAEGGYARGSASYKGGRGGYAEGIIQLAVGETLYAYVGGRGPNGTTSLTGAAFNGGGKGGYSNYSSSDWRNGGGGGGTDLRIGGNTLYHRVIVAGGGGGGTPNKSQSNAHGGGNEGGYDYSGKQGTQTGGNAFGVGGSSSSNGEGNRYSVPGGGGGWYGAKAQTGSSSSDSWSDSMFYTAGGSGFVWTGQSTVPSGYLVQSKYILDLVKNIAGSQSHESVNGGTETGHLGNGYARISAMGLKKVTPTYVTSPGAYHNPELGLISISTDGENWITISDKNVGATVADPEDTDSYGDIFQYGNIYHFDGEGSGGTVTTEAQIPDLTGYEGGNLYSNDKYRTNIDWNAANKKLWKPVAFENLLSLQKGPCDKGFHIPSAEEWTAMLNAILELEGEEAEFSYDLIARYLLMSHPNARKGDGDFYSSNTSIYFTNSYIANQNKINAFVMIGDEGSESGGLSATDMNCGGYIRGFRDVVMVPTYTGWTKIGGGSTVRLPLEYQEVAYIESTGTQSINSGVVDVWDTLNVYMEFSITSTQSNHEDGLFGGKGSSSNQAPTIFLPDSSPKQLKTRFGSGTTQAITSSAISLNTKHILDITHTTSQRYGTIDGTSFSFNQSVAGSANNNTSGYFSFFCDGSTVASYSYMKLYRGKITVNGTLVRDFIPCYRRIDGVVGMYDLVNNQFYANAGSGSFLKGADVNVPELPHQYQEVEYLESSATQYIDTGYVPTVNTEIGTRLAWGGTQDYWAVFYGVTSSDSAPDGILGRLFYASDRGAVTTYNRWFCNSDYAECQQASVSLDTFHNVYSKKNYSKIDSSTPAITTSGTPYQGNIYMFCGNNGGSAWRFTRCKIASFLIAESGTLVRYMIPCKRNSDGEPGFYDLINNVFYTNRGSGQFTCGGELIRHYQNNEHTILYWPLSGTAKDLSGTNSDGVATSVSYPNVNGTKVAQFTASSSNIYNNNSFIASCNGTKQFTYGLWFKLTSLPSGSNRYFIGWTGQTDYGSYDKCILFKSDGALNCYNYTTTSYGFTSAAGTVQVGEWYCIVYTYDGVNMKVYLNNQLLGQSAAPGSYDYSAKGNGRFIIGKVRDDRIGFAGYVGDAFIEDIGRDAAYVDNYYNNTKNRYIG